MHDHQTARSPIRGHAVVKPLRPEVAEQFFAALAEMRELGVV